MNDEKWERLVDNIDSKFGIESFKKEDVYRILDNGEKKKHGFKEVVIFNGMKGKMKVERTSKPTLLDKKVYYSGKKSDSRVEYIYSDAQFMHKVVGYKWNGKDWEEIDFSLI